MPFPAIGWYTIFFEKIVDNRVNNHAEHEQQSFASKFARATEIIVQLGALQKRSKLIEILWRQVFQPAESNYFLSSSYWVQNITEASKKMLENYDIFVIYWFNYLPTKIFVKFGVFS